MRKVISFCVWGKSPIYNYGLYENALLLPKVFPDWIMVVYFTKTADLEVIRELVKMKKVECIPVDFPDNSRNTMLRFVAAFDPDNDVVIFRDADSRLLKRDFDAVNAWLKTGKELHIIRDHPFNGIRNRIQAGMWGVRNQFLMEENIILKFYKYFSDTKNSKWTIDQKYLGKFIYPLLNKNNSLIHSNFFKGEDWAQPFPQTDDERKDYYFIGATVNNTENASKKFKKENEIHQKIRHCK